MAHELTRFGACRAETHAIHDVIQTGLEKPEQDFAGVAGTGSRRRIVTTELTFQKTVGALHLLLFAQLRTVVRKTLSGNLTVLSGFDFNVFDLAVERATSALEVKIRALTTGELQLGTEISSHFLVTSSILRANRIQSAHSMLTQTQDTN